MKEFDRDSSLSSCSSAPEQEGASGPAKPASPESAPGPETLPPGVERPPEPYAHLPEDLRTPWDWPDLIAFLVLILGSGLVIPILAGLAAMTWWGVPFSQIEKSPAIKAAILIASQALWSAATLAFLFVLVRLRQPGSFWRAIGWRQLRPRSMTRAAATLTCLLGGAGLAMTIQLASALVGKRAKLPIEELFQSRQSVLLLMALGILVAPLVEETIFRGYLYPVLARHLGIPGGIVLTGALFGMAHAAQLWGGWGQIVLLVVVGTVLTYVRARTGTVLASYFVHLAYNTSLFLGFYVATKGLHNIPVGS